MIKSLSSLLAHQTFVSVALTDTGAVRTLRFRTAYVVAVVAFALSGWLALALAGDVGRAKLAVAITGDVQAKKYLAIIDDLERQRDAEREQVKLIAQELGALQLRLDRFDALGSKLEKDGTLVSEADSLEGKGGPLAESPLGESISIEDVKAQVGLLTRKADYAELALETGLAMSIRKALGPSNDGLPFYFPVMSTTARATSSYGWRTDPVRGGRAFHSGGDIADKVGTPVVAAGEGTVIFSGWRFGYGNLIEVKHTQGFTTRYAHLSKRIAAEGDRVYPGDLIALLGNTGRSTGPHLHFEVRRDGQPLNPYPFVKDTRLDVMELAAKGRGKELLAAWKNGGKVAAR
ncbi:MAG: M23 family metallopeptidase [Pseudomonadaceae bacterium]|nr:M23 family metallopeptidase [Pseudomonadaceae bacterium]